MSRTRKSEGFSGKAHAWGAALGAMRGVCLKVGLVCVWMGCLGMPHTVALPLEFQDGVLLRDAEIEEVFHLFADPLLKAAGLSPAKIHIFLVKAPEVNALSGVGGLILINTGLILRCESAEELIAVLAHEIGHIKNGHIIGRVGAFGGAQNLTLASVGVGGLIALLTGRFEALVAAAGLGMHAAERTALCFTRSQEGAADQVSFALLDKLEWPIDGAVALFQKLAADAGPLQDEGAAYAQTHPLSQSRADSAARRVQRGKHLPPAFQKLFQRMQGKILAYSLPPSQVLGHPALQSGSLGHVIGLYRQGKLDAALASLEGLMAHEKSAYFWEFKAQILFELRQFEAAAQAAENAIQQSVRANGSLYLLLAQIKIAQGSPRDLQKAISLLEKAVALDPEDPQIWRWMSTAYGMSGQAGMAALCLGEEFLRRGDVPRATEYAQKAVKTLGPGTPQRLRADDLVRHLKTLSL